MIKNLEKEKNIIANKKYRKTKKGKDARNREYKNRNIKLQEIKDDHKFEDLKNADAHFKLFKVRFKLSKNETYLIN